MLLISIILTWRWLLLLDCQSRIKIELADKPGSVVDSHSSGRTVTSTLKQPTRAFVRAAPLGPYSVLLRVGFAMPLMLPPARCALTAPFHPYPDFWSRRYLSVALSVGSRPPGITWHPALWSPDFPLQPKLQRLSSQLLAKFKQFWVSVQMLLKKLNFVMCNYWTPHSHCD